MRRTWFRGKAVEEFVPTARAERVLWSLERQGATTQRDVVYETSWRREKGEVGAHLCLTSLTTNSLKRKAIATNSSGTSLNDLVPQLLNYNS